MNTCELLWFVMKVMTRLAVFLYGLVCNACSQDHRIRWKDVSVYQNDGVEARRITLNHWTSQKLSYGVIMYSYIVRILPCR